MRNIKLLILIPCIFVVFSCYKSKNDNTANSVQNLSRIDSLLILQKTNPDDYRLMSQIWSYYIVNSMGREMIRNAYQVYQSRENMDMVKLYAGTYLAQAYIPIDYDSVKFFLDEVSPYVKEIGDRTLVPRIYNTEAIYSIQKESDYAYALDCFLEALSYIEKSKDSSNILVLSCNIANLYAMREDTSGLQYAKRAYHLCKKLQDDYVYPVACRLYSQLLIHAGELDSAVSYALELSDLSQQTGKKNYAATAFLLQGNIYNAKGEIEKASNCFKKALEYTSESLDRNTLTKVYRDYGYFLIKTGNIDEAERIFIKALKHLENTGNEESKGKIFDGLSQVYDKKGDITRSFYYYKLFRNFTDSVKISQKDKEFNRLIRQYEVIKHQESIKDRELKLAKANHRIYLIGFALAIAIIITIFILVLYKRKNRMYHQLVETHQKLVKAEKSQIVNDVNDESSIGDSILFGNIEKLMSEQRMYKQNDISLDKLAESTKSNRYYVSRVINRFSGKTFYNYVNGYRIKEAVRILSDTENNIPLKTLCAELGYNSLSAFYRSFYNEIGVPPSRYRDEVRKIHSQDNSR